MPIHNKFQGMSPRLSPLLLGPNRARFAENCNFLSGAISSLKENVFIERMTEGMEGFIPIGDNVFHQVPNHTRRVAAASFINNSLVGERIIYDDDNGLAYRNTDGTTFTFGSMPNLLDVLPSNNSILSIERTGTGSLEEEDTEFIYAVALVNRHGDESSLSRTVMSRAKETDILTLTVSRAFLDEVVTSEINDDLKIRVYRSSTGSFLLLRTAEGTDFDIPTTGNFTFIDEISNTLLSATKLWPTERTDLPSGVRGVLEHDRGFVICHDNHTIYMSDPLAYSMFPQSFRISFGEQILGIEEYYNRIIIFLTNHKHTVLELSSPYNISRRSPESSYQCVSGASIARLGNHGVLFASVYGLCLTDGLSTQLLTQHHFHRESFAPYQPQTIRIFAGDEDFVMVSNTEGSFLFQRGFEMTRLSEQVVSAQLYSGEWYAATRNQNNDLLLCQMFTSTNNRRLQWDSGQAALRRPETLTSAAIIADYRQRNGLINGGIATNDDGIGTLLEGIGSDPSEVIDADLISGFRLAITMEDRYRYEVPNPFRSVAPSSVGAASGRQTTIYEISVSGRGTVHQVALATSEKRQDYIPGPGGNPR